MTDLAAAGRTAIAKSSTASKVWYGGLGVFMVLGLYAFIRQEVGGQYVTGLTNATPWGLYVAVFVFLVGISAGSTIIGLMVHGFGRKGYAPLATRALLVGLIALAAAVTFIMLDVGRIERAVFVPLLDRNLTSVQFYSSLSYILFGLILLMGLYYTVKASRGMSTARDAKLGRWLAIAAVPFALVVLQGVDGALFAGIQAREFWNSALLPPHFAVGALVSGTAVMMIVAVVAARIRGRDLVSRDVLTQMGVLLVLFIAIAAPLDFFDFLVFRYSNTAGGDEAWQFLAGAQLPFSILHVGGYVAAIAILLSSKRRKDVRWLTAAAAVALVAVAAYRYNLIVVGMELPLLPFFANQPYWPSGIEVMLTLGVIALGLCAYSVLTRVIPMEEEDADPAASPLDATGQTWTPQTTGQQPAK